MKHFSPSERPERILIADDDRVWRRLVANSLEGAGFSVLEAEDGAQAVAMAEQATPDLAILDIAMPGMSGIDVARSIKVPTLFLSLHEEEDVIDAALLDEPQGTYVIGYLVKSISIEKLLPTIRAAVRTAYQINARRELMVAMARSREQEKRDLAMALHDELGQHLVGIMLDADFLANTTSKEARRRATQIKSSVKSISANLHRLLNELRPESLETLGLNGSIQSLVEQWAGRLPSIAFQVDVDQELSCVDPESELCVYRLIQESLTNVAKHAAEATTVSVRVMRDSSCESIQVEVVDDGTGLNPEDRADGFGLKGISDRVAVLGGQVSITHHSPRGTRISAVLPIRLDQSARK